MWKIFNSFWGTRSIYGHGGYLTILKVAYPLIIMSASHSVMQFADRMFLANYSSEDVAASLPAGILYFTLFCFFMVTCNFSSALIAQLTGAGRKEEVLKVVGSGVFLAAMAGLFITFALPLIGYEIMHSFAQRPELLAQEWRYFSGLLPSGVFVCFAAPFFAFFSGRGKTIPVAIINVAGCVLNIGLDYAFIFGKWGIPEMGIYGAGIATSLCCAFSMSCVIFWFLWQDQAEYPTRKRWNASWEYVKKIFVYGAPSGLQTFFDVGSFALVSFLIASLGKEALVATVIALSVNNIFFIPLLGLSDASSIVVGQYIGRARHNIANRVAYRTWRISALYMLLGAIVYTAFPEALAEMFRPNEGDPAEFARVVGHVRWIFLLAVLFNSFDAVKFVFMGALRGAGDTQAILLISSCCAWGLLVPLSILYTQIYPLGVREFWSVLAFYYVIEGTLLLWRFRAGHWRNIRMIQPEHQAEANMPLEEMTVQNP